jgi:hypothetical protein
MNLSQAIGWGGIGLHENSKINPEKNNEFLRRSQPHFSSKFIARLYWEEL